MYASREEIKVQIKHDFILGGVGWVLWGKKDRDDLRKS